MVVLLGLLMCRSWFSILLNRYLVFGFFIHSFCYLFTVGSI
jgi:hypothetical protein